MQWNEILSIVILLDLTKANQVRSPPNKTIAEIATNGNHHVFKPREKPMNTVWRKCNDYNPCVDIFDGLKVISSYQNKFIVDNKTMDMQITNVTFNDTGIYQCISNESKTLKISTTEYHLIVLDDNIICTLTISKPVRTCDIINCSFQYQPKNECQVTPVRINSRTKKTLELLNKSTDYNGGYIWMHLKENVDNIEDIVSITLSFLCNRKGIISNVSYDGKVTLAERCTFEKSKTFITYFVVGAAICFLGIIFNILYLLIRRKFRNMQSIRFTELPDPPTCHHYDAIEDVPCAVYKAPHDSVTPTVPKKQGLKKSFSLGDSDLLRSLSNKSSHPVFRSCSNCAIYDLEGSSDTQNAQIAETQVYKVPQKECNLKYSSPFSNSVTINGAPNMEPPSDKVESATYHELENLELKAT